MNINRTVTIAAAASIAVGLLAAASAHAAPKPRPELPVAKVSPIRGGTTATDPLAPQAGKPIEVPCCHCIGDKNGNVLLHTGTAGWRLASAPQLPPGSPLYMPSAVHPLWTASLPPAKWLQAYSGFEAPHPAGHYIYELPITVPDCTIPEGVKLRGYAAADDDVTATLIGPGGGPLGATAPGGYGFTAAKVIGIAATLVPGGTYTLRMDVNNGGGPSGLLVNAWIETACSSSLVKGGRVIPPHDGGPIDPR